MIPRKHKELLHSIGEYAGKLGLKAWVVGGAVRDFYRGKDTQDLDLTFEGSPEAVAGFCIKKWGGEKKRFSQFNTYRVKLNNGLKLPGPCRRYPRLRLRTTCSEGILRPMPGH